jgi:hypothetical protein
MDAGDKRRIDLPPTQRGIDPRGDGTFVTKRHLRGIGSQVAFEKELKRQEVQITDRSKKHGNLLDVKLLRAIISNDKYNPSIFPWFEG